MLTVVILKSLNAVQDLDWIGGDISSERAPNPENVGNVRFLVPVTNWQF